MKNTFISRFTPSLMAPETLEDILVQRHTLANYLVDKIRDSATTDNKYFQLLIGPRGIGKTHLVSLIYHRVAKMEDLQDKLLIAWLREEEWGIASFLDLLRGIFRAIAQEYPAAYKAQLHDEVEKLYDLSLEQAEYQAAELLREFVGNRVLLLIVENLEDVFSGLGDFGQKQLRAYIQNHSFLTILATSQSLFDGVKLYDNPFYGFFYSHILNEFKVDDAVDLLNHIAKLEGNTDLASFIQTPTGRDRIKVVHYLSGGSPRVYIVFSAFLMTPESLDKLVEPFMEMLDSLTPYYQDRMKYISNQQRKIVDFLCDRGGAAPVKEIAKYCFITHQTVSSQLKDLLEKGYVKKEEIGRESWYELREPLMRFCLEVKKQRNQPIRLIVDFIRVWYTREELQQRLGLRMADVDFAEKECHFMYRQGLKPIPPDAVMDREYHTRALEAIENNEEDPLLKAYYDEMENCIEQKDDVSALAYAERLVTSRGEARDWLEKGRCLNRLKRRDEALECLDKAIEIDSNYARAWANKGNVLKILQRYEEALVSFDKAIALDPSNKWAWAWAMRSNVLNNLRRDEEALVSCDRAIALDPNYQWAWYMRGNELNNLKRYEEALVSFDRAIELDANNQSFWVKRGNLLNNLKRYDEALVSFDHAIELDANDKWAWRNRGNVLKNLKRYEEALESYDRAIERDANYQSAWRMRGNVLYNLKRYDEALVSCDRAIELDANDPWDWNNRGNVLNNLKRYDEALVSYDRAIKLDANYKWAWANRGNVLDNLNRYDEALVSLDRAIELDANYKWAWANRGDVLNSLKRYEEALASYDKAIELDPNDRWSWTNRGGVLYSLKRYEEALASYDKAIELDPNDRWSWTNRGYIMGKQGYFLGKQEYYEEALLSFNKTIEFDEQDKYAWNNRGWVLCRLGQYDQALISLEKAIEFGFPDWYAFFNRAESLLALNQWDEGITALDDAIYRFTQEDMTEIDNTEAIVRNLFNNTSDIAISQTCIKTLIELYNKHNIISILGQGIVRNIPALMSEMVSDKAARTWLELWQQPTSNYQQFQIPIRLLNAAVRYKETKGDRRVLLELPIEERNLLEPLVLGKVE
ncbi:MULTISPECIES: tetratricopeptide repeat protein [unclassified Microcoleus]|uniref:tetratricopeptide repeat protein n=1 Tax=unclassified Microcoleus TaxID=2642155 RepID=UPI001DCAB71E|nr:MULTISPECIES: tetratricopeptide repeat protein [unclassified Microcoleus]MCC3567838.1 tetratricopeptide repeat protein [Microcoleus sp. PH2017_31_RDM_U_A]MCC3577673.1 tetratricopeptide repeat protein [Microcoleus sp. PH2017_32_RDM_D_A]MCC3615791.1 tetratricopeptide repeat protein [Microcoleus sp. PH2017_38_RDM_U_B]